MKKKIVLIPENLYRQPVWLIIGYTWDSKELQRFLDKNMDMKEEEKRRIKPRNRTGAKWVIDDDTGKSFIWVDPGVRGQLPVLVHEIGHLCIYVMESRGLPINEACSEAFAYLMEYYSNEAFYHLGLGKMTHYKR